MHPEKCTFFLKEIFKIFLIGIIISLTISKSFADVPYEVFKTHTVAEVTIPNNNDVIVKDGKAYDPNGNYTQTVGTVDTRVKTKLSGINYKLEFRNVGSMGNKGWTSVGGYHKAKLIISYIIEKSYHMHDTGVAHPMFENNNFFEEVDDETQYIDNIEFDLIFDGGPYGIFKSQNKNGGFDWVGNIVDGRYVYLTNVPNRPHLVGSDVQIPIEPNMFGKWMEKLVVPPCQDSGVRFSDFNGEITYGLDLDDRDSFNVAELDAVLCVDTIISTGDDSTCVLSLADMTTFKMKPNSDIRLSNPKQASKLELITGKILVNVKRMLKDGTMDVEMSQATAGIKGTIFELEETGTESKLKVFEGVVEFTSKATGDKSMVGIWETQDATKEGLGIKTTKDNREIFKKINKERQEWEKMKETPLKPLLSQEEINKIRVRDPDRGEIELAPGSVVPDGSDNIEQDNNKPDEKNNIEQDDNKPKEKGNVNSNTKEESPSNNTLLFLLIIIGFIGFSYFKFKRKK